MRARTCQECGKDFVQTFGGRPRKKCYECVPARTKQTVVERLAEEVQFSSKHCGYCGAYTVGERQFCNSTHEARAHANIRAGYNARRKPTVRFVTARTRPIELVRKRRERDEQIRQQEARAKAARTTEIAA